MILLTRLSQSLMALLICLLAGIISEHLIAGSGEWAYAVSRIYLSILSMATIPLLLVATIFGLRQMMTLPFPTRRIIMIVGSALALVLSSALVSLVLGYWTAAGANIDNSDRAKLGALVLRSAGDASNIELSLFSSVNFSAAGGWMLNDLLPDNFFRVLVEGQSIGILTCALLFGVAFSAVTRGEKTSLVQLFEAIYRVMELIIAKANLLLPIVAFGMAAHITSEIDLEIIAAMRGFLLNFFILAITLCSLALIMVHRWSGHRFTEVLHQLKNPMLVSLISSSMTATIPHTIEAMSNRLGYSRGIVEFVVPTASVYLRAGSAVYFVLLTLFVSNLYSTTITPLDLAIIGFGATLASFASAGHDSLTNLGFASMVLSWLQLPIEAALALFLAIEFVTQGPRNLVTLLVICALIAIVSRGLPSERTLIKSSDSIPIRTPLQLVLNRSQLLFISFGGLLLSLLIILMGVSVGLRQASFHHDNNPKTEQRIGKTSNPGDAQ